MHHLSFVLHMPFATLYIYTQFEVAEHFHLLKQHHQHTLRYKYANPPKYFQDSNLSIQLQNHKDKFKIMWVTKVKVGVLRPVQQPGSYWDRSSELPLVGLEPTEVTAYD